MENKSKYFLEKNFIIYLTGKVISTLFNFASVPLFIKYFGIANFGKLSLLYTTFLMFIAGTTGWISQGVLRFYSMEDNKASFSSEIAKLTIKTSLIAGMLMAIFFVYNKSSLFTTLLATLAFIFACLYSVSVSEHQARFLSMKVIFSDIFRMFLYFLIPLILYNYIPSIRSEFAFFIGVLVSYLGALLMINGWKLPKLFPDNENYVNWSKRIWNYGSPLSVWMILSPALNTSDRYIINFFMGVTAVGEYSAIYDIFFKLFSQLTAPFNNIIQPLLINNFNVGKKKEFNKNMLRSVIYLTLMFIGLFTVVLFLKHFIIYSYLGFSNNIAMTLEKIVIPLLISSFFWQISILLQKKLEINNNTKSLVLYMIISLMIGAVISVYFINTYGYSASAYGMLASSVVYLFIILKHFF